MKLTNFDREFHAFLDERPIYDRDLLAFNSMTAVEYANSASESYAKMLEIVIDDKREISRRSEELRYSIIHAYDAKIDYPDLQYRQEVQEARDRERMRDGERVPKKDLVSVIKKLFRRS